MYNSEYFNTEKYKEAYMLQSDYINGTGKHGDILKKYADLASRYEDVFQKSVFMPEGLSYLYNEENETLKKGLKNDVILLAVALFFGVGAGRIGWIVISFVIFIVKMFQEDNLKWIWMASPIAAVSLAILSVLPAVSVKWMLLAAYGPLIAQTGSLAVQWICEKNSIKNARETNRKKMIQIKDNEKILDSIRRQMADMLPALKKEYQQQLYQMIKKGAVLESIGSEYKNLPEKFWWMVSPTELYFQKRRYESAFYQLLVYQEIKAFSRKRGEEFDAEEEFAPMLAEDFSHLEVRKIYQRNKELVARNHGIILDFINCLTYPTVEKESETVDVYQKNFIQRVSETHEWEDLGEEMRRANRDGRLSDTDYNTLTLEYDMADPEVRAGINATKKETREWNQYKENICFAWTGQALLMPCGADHGSYVLVDYRCLPEYTYENLRALQQYHIVGALSDNVSCDSCFLAELHQRYGRGCSLSELGII